MKIDVEYMSDYSGVDTVTVPVAVRKGAVLGFNTDDGRPEAQYPYWVKDTIGDGVQDDHAAIQRALDKGGFVQLGKPKVYFKISQPLILSVQNTVLNGLGMLNTFIVNTGTGPTIRVLAQYCEVKNMALFGSVQAAYGVGATATYGVEFLAGDYGITERLAILYHQYGIYNHGGGSSLEHHRNNVRHITYDGLYSVTPSGAEQNGNAMEIIGGGYNLCGRAGVRWHAAQLGMFGVRCEANREDGVVIDSSTSTITSKAIGINSCYFEQNEKAQIRIKTGSGVGLYHAHISGNYLRFSPTGTETALLIGEGPGTIQLLDLQGNGYLAGGPVTHWVNLNNRSTDSCTINQMEQPSLFTGLNTAKVLSYFTAVDIDTSAKLRAIVTDETGTGGSLVFSTNPQFGASIGIGTPASGTSLSPITTLSDSNGTANWVLENTNTGTSAAAGLITKVSGRQSFFGMMTAAHVLATIANRAIVQPDASGAGITEYLAAGQNWDVQVVNSVKAKVDAPTVAGQTSIQLYDVDTVAVQRILVGAAGTGPGGVGRALYLI